CSHTSSWHNTECPVSLAGSAPRARRSGHSLWCAWRLLAWRDCTTARPPGESEADDAGPCTAGLGRWRGFQPGAVSMSSGAGCTQAGPSFRGLLTEGADRVGPHRRGGRRPEDGKQLALRLGLWVKPCAKVLRAEDAPAACAPRPPVLLCRQ